MNKLAKDLPILFIPFSRIEIATRVFERIKEAQPKRLYLAMDAPRSDRPDEQSANAKLREKFCSEATYGGCELITLFANENLGPNIFIEKAIDWFFDQEDGADFGGGLFAASRLF